MRAGFIKTYQKTTKNLRKSEKKLSRGRLESPKQKNYFLCPSSYRAITETGQKTEVITIENG